MNYLLISVVLPLLLISQVASAGVYDKVQLRFDRLQARANKLNVDYLNLEFQDSPALANDKKKQAQTEKFALQQLHAELSELFDEFTSIEAECEDPEACVDVQELLAKLKELKKDSSEALEAQDQLATKDHACKKCDDLRSESVQQKPKLENKISTLRNKVANILDRLSSSSIASEPNISGACPAALVTCDLKSKKTACVSSDRTCLCIPSCNNLKVGLWDCRLPSGEMPGQEVSTCRTVKDQKLEKICIALYDPASQACLEMNNYRPGCIKEVKKKSDCFCDCTSPRIETKATPIVKPTKPLHKK